MRWIIFLLFIVMSVSISAFTEYGCLFLSLEPSSINQAMGQTVGVINIWHNNPLTLYANPALVSFHEGIAYGYKHNPGNIEGFDNINYNAAIASFGYKGIGFTLPALNRRSKLGINIDYGRHPYYDELGNMVGSYRPQEDAATFGFAMNPLEILRTPESNSLLKHFDISIGLTRLGVVSDLGYIDIIDAANNTINKGKTTVYNIGMIAGVNYNWEDYLAMEGVVGFARFNLFEEDILYPRSDKERIYTHLNEGYGYSVSIPSNRLTSFLIEYDSIFEYLVYFSHIISYRFLSSTITFPDFDSHVNGKGSEFGIFDTIFIRRGRYEDRDGEVVGDTSGYGINLHYKKLISLSYNYAKFPGGPIAGSHKSEDIGFSVDILRAVDLITNR